ncbi:MAG: hypothetical protein ACOY3F_08070 [Bacillota bacterium]
MKDALVPCLAETPGACIGDSWPESCEEAATSPVQLGRPKDSLPEIDAAEQNLEVVTGQAIAALNKANEPEPWLFVKAGVPVRIEPAEDGLLVARELTPDRLRHVLARVARWYVVKDTKNGPVRLDAKPPMCVVRDVLAAPGLPLPPLVAVVRTPVFAPDGSFQTEPGYHPATRTYLAPDPGLSVPPVPERPTARDVEAARAVILEDLLGDFPFVGEADRAHAVALLVLPFVRAMIDGPTPLHVVEASSPGSGKGLLANVLLYPATGQHVGMAPPAGDDEELRKALTGRFRDGAVAILFDNVAALTSPVLAAALTATWWDDRILGKSETVRLPVRCAWAATSNNAVLSTDVARRSVRIRLDPKCDRPWLRTGFRHPNLRAWAARERGTLIWSAAVLVRNWVNTRRPGPSCKPLGSFEFWTEAIGGVLEAAGIAGFLANADEFYEAADPEGAIWRDFVALWWQRFGDKPTAVADLFPLAVELDFDLGKASSERAARIAFGRRLARQRDRVIGDYAIRAAGRHQGAALWRLVRVTP